MIDKNYKPVVEKVDKLLSRLNTKNLTSTEKIRVIKTLIVPKINHLILTLPNPTLEYMRRFEKKTFQIYLDMKSLEKLKEALLFKDMRIPA